jgi:hypothetical protein
MNRLFNLLHPYSRYGLAVALFEERLDVDRLSADEAPEMLTRAIESGLSSFRLATGDSPATAEVLRFDYLKMEELVRDPGLIQGALSAQGKYLAPAVVTTDRDAKGTWDNAVKILGWLREGEGLETSFPLSRSFAPTTAKINNGRSSQSPPKTSLFEAACSVIATLTEKKPAAWVNKLNTVIVPDLPLAELKDFVELFSDLMRDELDGNLFEAVLPAKSTGNATTPPQSKRGKKAQAAAPKSEYRRPRLHNGNYPFAPRDAAFGPVGLLAAIGKWARRADRVAYARKVLESIAGAIDQPGKPLYIISYDSVSQVQFTHHIVGLSLEGKLSEMIDALIRETTLYAEMDKNKPKWELPAYRLFYLMTSRFLQQFTLPAFRDFLAARAEYAPAVQPLFEEYFMNARKIDRPLVESARALGQWLNRTAYFVADGEVDQNAADRRGKVQKAKAKILVEFESAAMSAKSPRDMLHRISTRAGRLLQQDIPAEATLFMDATNCEEVAHEDALHLLVAYLRLRATKIEAEPQASGTAA